MKTNEFKPGQTVTCTDKLGINLVEFRGWFTNSCGETMACVIFRIEGECQFQTEVKPTSLTA